MSPRRAGGGGGPGSVVKRCLTIAVDGPASSGKGTVARRVAAVLGYGYVDTGAMYRGVALRVLRVGEDPGDAAAAERLARVSRFRFAWDEGRFQVFLDGEDVSHAIRTEVVSAAASAVAEHPGVRAALLQAQRDLGAGGGVVMDGRDIGTVVLPDAELKVFLDASLAERARRRAAELPDADPERVRNELAVRDARDSGRAAAPLHRAADAVVIDSTGMSIDQVVERVLALARARGA